MNKTIILSCACFLAGCALDDNNDFYITEEGKAVIVFLLAMLAYVMIAGKKMSKQVIRQLDEQGLTSADFIECGTYVSGHPALNENIKDVWALVKGGQLRLYTTVNPEYAMPANIAGGSIAADDISDIRLEDSTTIERRITLGRMLLVGLFALAWRKKKKNELAFVSVIWSYGKFPQETIFMFEGKQALDKANTSRNRLMRQLDEQRSPRNTDSIVKGR